MSDDFEPSILEYARFYGIALDHLKQNPLHECSAPDNISVQLEDPPDVFRINDSSGGLPLERLSVGTEAAILLSSLQDLGQQRRFDEDIELDVHRFQEIKQESPILRTDHELDLQSFAPRVVPDLENEHLPLEQLDEEADEGLEWPSRYYELPDKLFSEAEAEKPYISREGLVYLQDVLRSLSNDGKDVVFEDDKFVYERVCRSTIIEKLKVFEVTIDRKTSTIQ